MMDAALFLAEGFEEIEVSTPICFLRHMGIGLGIVSVTGSLDVTGAHGLSVKADMLWEDADFSKTRMLILPGGVPGAENLSKSVPLCNLVKTFVEEDKYVAAICAGPMVLGKQGLLRRKRIVCYPGFEELMLEASVQSGQNVVVDGKLITANGPASAMQFSYYIGKALAGEAEARAMADAMMVNYF